VDAAAGLAKRGGRDGVMNMIFPWNRRQVDAVPVNSRDEPNLHWPVSQACTQGQMAEPAYAYWCEQIREIPRAHRKQWEFCYILQSLARYGALAPGMHGLGFGVGGEPLTAIFAARGARILATDLEPERAEQEGWVHTAQHASTKQTLNDRGICEATRFDALVDFRFMDMNAIDADLAGGYDFCWSACALEHLGSIEKGLDFIVRSVECLKPGGVAVHTTELNCSSNSATLDNAATVLFRRKDFLRLGKRLAAQGCRLSFNFNLGQQPLDRHVDVPPYSVDDHLKLQIDKWTSTSFGIIVEKKRS
jgi:2-polyprenyl-3-methyl-5-hydroxy-6-metoxy-1,4-benzoquinol methylase